MAAVAASVEVVQWGDDPIEVVVHNAPGDIGDRTVVLAPDEAAALASALTRAAEQAARGERDHHYDDFGKEIA